MFTRILVPIDFSEPAAAALDYAIALATRFGASLELLHVIDDPVGAGVLAGDGFITQSPEEQATATAEAESRLAAFASAAHPRVPMTTTVTHGRAALRICEVAREAPADLIVIGTHGRKGLSHVLLGSVAERVVRHASAPVLTVHARPGIVYERAANWATAMA